MAGTAQKALDTTDAVAEQLSLATEQILVVTPSLRAEAVAEALRAAAVERGVAVFIVTLPSTVEAPGSYAPSLALLPNVQIRQALTTRRFALLSTSAHWVLVEGALIEQSVQTVGANPTYVLTDTEVIAARAEHFQKLWRGGAPYTSFIERDSP